MTTSLSVWVAGARPRTLPAAVAPVLAGTGIALWMDHGSIVRALLAAAVALLFQIGVNFSKKTRNIDSWIIAQE